MFLSDDIDFASKISRKLTLPVKILPQTFYGRISNKSFSESILNE
jgi:hypothetical protein